MNQNITSDEMRSDVLNMASQVKRAYNDLEWANYAYNRRLQAVKELGYPITSTGDIEFKDTLPKVGK